MKRDQSVKFLAESESPQFVGQSGNCDQNFELFKTFDFKIACVIRNTSIIVAFLCVITEFN